MLREWRYRLEKGRPHLILLVALLLLIISLSVVGGLIVWVLGGVDNALSAIWWTFLHLSDPGYLGDDDTPVAGVFGTVFTILGMVVFVAGIVGILTSLITSGLIRLREGGTPISFRGHIVIVGWNGRVFTLVRDLLHANGDYKIAILAPHAKDDAENQMERRVFGRIEELQGEGAARRARGHVVYRQGTPSVEQDLHRVAAAQARRFILLADELEAEGIATDVAQIRNLYSIERAHLEGDSAAERYSTVVELVSDQLRSHAFYAMRIDPRRDAWVAYYEEQLRKRGLRSYLPKPAGEASQNDLTAVNTDQIVSRVIVQCAVQPYLSGVYEELFSFSGKEFFLWQPDQQWQTIWKDLLALPAPERSGFLARHTRDGIVVGRVHPQGFSFSPQDWTELNDVDSYVVLGDKQRWNGQPDDEKDATDFAVRCDIHATVPQDAYRVLVLGMNRRFPLILEQFRDYAEQYADMELTIDVVALDGDAQLPESTATMHLNLRRADYTQWPVLGDLVESEDAYDTIVLLSEDKSIDHPEVDARVTLALVMLRALRDDASWGEHLQKVNIVAEVRDPRNRNILHQEKLAGDVVVGDQYVSGFIAQACVDHRLEELYREILDYGQYEIYARRQKLTQGDKPVRFGDLVAATAVRGEVAIGFLQQQDDGQKRPVLAPDLDVELSADDLPLVIAGR